MKTIGKKWQSACCNNAPGMIRRPGRLGAIGCPGLSEICESEWQ